MNNYKREILDLEKKGYTLKKVYKRLKISFKFLL